MEPAPANPAAEQVLHELSHQLMSPYCPGRTIASCSSQAARRLEEDILTQAQAGRTRDEIEATLVERFGPQVIGYAGRPVLLWGTGALAAVAIALVFVSARRWARGATARTAGAGPAEPAPASEGTARAAPSELAAVEDELDRLDEF
jgi:cytochrome c-type biogenesis protein CcmH/NrfF